MVYKKPQQATNANTMIKDDNLNIPHEPEPRRAWIKYQLELRGYTYADIARELDCTRQSVQKAMSQGNQRIQRFVAEKLDLQPEQIWPERYDEYGTPLRFRGRPPKVVTTTKESSIAKGVEERAA